jgi:hypothetical protein
VLTEVAVIIKPLKVLILLCNVISALLLFVVSVFRLD